MKRSTSMTSTVILALLFVLPSYWALLFFMDSMLGTGQIYAAVMYESKHALLMQLLSDGPRLLIVFTPFIFATALVLYTKLPPKKKALLIASITAPIIVAPTVIGFSFLQALLLPTTAILSLAVAAAFTAALCRLSGSNSRCA